MSDYTVDKSLKHGKLTPSFEIKMNHVFKQFHREVV